MITTTVDVSAIADLGKRFITLQQADSLLRSISSGMLGETSKRIHKRGENADGSPIGEYSDSYLKLRQSEKYKRDASKKVILSLTRQMEGDYTIVEISNTEYGLGFSNPINAKKANWSEERFGKVYALTPQELEGVRAIVQEFINNTFGD